MSNDAEMTSRVYIWLATTVLVLYKWNEYEIEYTLHHYLAYNFTADSLNLLLLFIEFDTELSWNQPLPAIEMVIIKDDVFLKRECMRFIILLKWF